MSPEQDLSGTTLERYRLLRRLGQGGMGTVYEGQHQMLDRHCAVKVLAPRFSTDERARKRFFREARAASRVAHPNVIEIYDVGSTPEHAYFAMELLEGEDLSERLARGGKLSWNEARPMVAQLLGALRAAHKAGVVHRDIKPANCFVLRGHPPTLKVLDFGISALASLGDNPATELTGASDVMGTAGYLPPETANGATKDHRSDLYSTGVLLFHLLTGRLPFEGAPLEVMAQHIGREPPAPRSMEPSIPAEVERAILRCMEKAPDDRFPDAEALGVALGLGTELATEAPARGTVSTRPAADDDLKVIGLDEHPEVIAQQREAAKGEPTSLYGRDPPPPAPPGGTQVANLGLDVPEGWTPGDLVRPPAVQRSAPSWRRPVGIGVAAAAVLGLGLLAWKYRAQVSEAVPEGTEALGLTAPEEVLLMIDTAPKDASVYVDDVLQTKNPAVVPKGEAPVTVRVEAQGYEPRSISLVPSTTRRLEVKLDRARGAKQRRGR